MSGRALFSPAECAAVVAEAEAAAAAAEGGWSTTRHYSVPTTDLPVHALPHTLHWFNAALRTSLAPMLAAQYPRTVAAAHRVRDANHSPSLRLPFATHPCAVLDAYTDHAQYSLQRGVPGCLACPHAQSGSFTYSNRPGDECLGGVGAAYESLSDARAMCAGAGARRVCGEVRRSGTARASHALRPVHVLAHTGAQPAYTLRWRWHFLRLAWSVAAP